MRKHFLLLFVTFFFFSLLNTNAQERELPGFLNFKWGVSKKKVKTEMQKRKSVLFVKEDEDNLYFTYGDFANENVNTWIFVFYNDKLAATGVRFMNQDFDTCEKLFWRLHYYLNDKYSMPDSTYKSTNPLLLKFDWNFKKKENVLNFIWLIFTEETKNSFNVQIQYYNHDLYDKYKREQEKKAKKDL